jgi:hypothetical protein
VILYVWLEKYFSRGDYRKQVGPEPRRLAANQAEEDAEGPISSAAAHVTAPADARRSTD